MTSAGFGYLAPFVAIVGATVGANLALLGLDIVWDRQARDRLAATDTADARHPNLETAAPTVAGR